MYNFQNCFHKVHSIMSSLEFEVPRAAYSQSAIAALFPRGTDVSIKSTDSATYVIVSTTRQYTQQGLGELYHNICSAQKPEHRAQPAQTHRVQHDQHNGGHVQHGQHHGGHVQHRQHHGGHVQHRQHGQHNGGHVQHGHHRGGHVQSAKHREYVGPEEFVHKGKSSIQTPRQGTMLTQGAWGWQTQP